jgi:hypothetical protein
MVQGLSLGLAYCRLAVQAMVESFQPNVLGSLYLYPAHT